MKIRLLVWSVLVVLVLAVFAATIVRSQVAETGVPVSKLQLTSYVIGQRYCGAKAGEINSLQIELGLRYTNAGEATFVLYNGVHSVIRQMVSRNPEDMSPKRFLVDASNLVVTSRQTAIEAGSAPGKSFVVLRPHASFETKTNVVILLNRKTNQAEGSLASGDYFLQVTVCTWHESQALAERLRRAWAGTGVLWYSNLTSDPIRFNISEDPVREDCSAFGELLREARANPNATDLSGNTGLIAALYQDERDTFLELLKKGADVNAKTQNGFTALIIAAGRGDSDAVAELLSRGADPNAKTDEGETPLLQAVQKCEPEIVKGLIDAGADVNVRNRNGRTILSLAESCPRYLRVDITGLLTKAGAK